MNRQSGQIFGLLLVTHCVSPLPFRAGIILAGISGAPASRQAKFPPSRYSASIPLIRNIAAAPWLSFNPFWQITTTFFPINLGTNSSICVNGWRYAVGISRGSAAKSSSIQMSNRTGHWTVPIRCESWETEVWFGEVMTHPSFWQGFTGCEIWAIASRGIRPPRVHIVTNWHRIGQAGPDHEPPMKNCLTFVRFSLLVNEK